MITEIKKHRVRHGDLMDNLDGLMKGELAEIFYSDPPWGAGNLRYWQTMNTKMNAVPQKEIDFQAFLNRVFDIAVQHSKNMVFIEYGIRWERIVVDMGEAKGLKHLGTATTLYKSGSRKLPLHLHIFTKNPTVLIPPLYIDNLTNTEDMQTLRNAVRPFAKAGEILLDPLRFRVFSKNGC